jgi:tripartite-type tricarboxylate transporter receptor subunit TctC
MARPIISTIAASALVVSALPASAEYPTRPITLVVPFVAGGSTDAIARIVGDHMAAVHESLFFAPNGSC